MAQENTSSQQNDAKEEIEEASINLDVFFVDLWKGFKKFWWTAVIFVAVFSLVAFFYVKRGYSPKYSTEVSFSISSSSTNSAVGGSTSYSTQYNSTLAEQLSKTFPYVISSAFMRQTLLNELGTPYINGTITANNDVANTPIFTIKVVSGNPEDAFNILNAVIKCYPRVAQYIIGETKMTVFSEPKYPENPINSFSCKKEVFIAAVAGLALSLGIMAIYALTRNSIRTREEIKRKLNQKCIVEIPFVKLVKRKTNQENLVTISNKHAGFSEAFRYLKKRVSGHLDKKGRKVLAITSTAPGEGKTTVSYNLALALARNGKKVALLDMDFTKKSIQENLQIPKSQIGLTDYLNGKCSIREIAKPQDMDNFHIFFAGTQNSVKNASAEYENLSDYVRDNYDYVIIDAPPSGVVSQTAQVINMADEVLFVLKQDYCTLTQIRKAIGFVSGINTNIMGFVFNVVSEGFEGYKGSYYGYYSSYGKYGYYGKKYGYYGKKYGYYGKKKYGYSNKKYGYGNGYGYGKSYGYGSGYGYGEKDDGYGYGYGSSYGYGDSYGYGYGGRGKFVSENLTDIYMKGEKSADSDDESVRDN